ncbi:AAA family ATPase [uncultured Parabacteroides sp.]|uniref:ATP-binding protein n=1 Tax=uncultured Parabacteroides sp. TaxID=512312 RepID=UPI002803D45B|nr:AAA family ATPase [uncultured Parabacteroides sp.]
MQNLYRNFRLQLELVSTDFIRFLHDKIAWDSRLIAIVGSRGVGKTTLLLQHIKKYEKAEDVLYITADDFYFTNHRLFDLAYQFYTQGGKKLFIDEIHKYKGWSTEIKNIYDQIPGLHVVYTGSSILDLEKGGADLSRRKVEYHLPGLSFREYINLTQGWQLPAYPLSEIVAGKVQFPYEKERPLKLFKNYLQAGYYPFFTETEYRLRLSNVVKLMIETDIPQFAEMNVASAFKLKKLLYVLAQSVPFKPNYTKLERDLEISRNTLPTYLLYLEKAGLINLLREKANGIKVLEKIDKIYLNNTDIAYMLSDTTPDIGNIRETVFFTWMRVGHFIISSPISDFEIDGRTFEVGGRNKKRAQIKNAVEGYIVKDDMEYAYQNEIPLWMFGFIY